MTVIVGALTKQGVTIAADGETSFGWKRGYGESAKIWADRGYAFGAAGCARTAQVLQHHVTWPAYHGPDEDGDFEEFLVRSLIPAMRRGVAGHGVVELDSGVEWMAGVFLIATGNRLAGITGSGYVHVEQSGRWAIGSGEAEALGYLGNEGPWTERQVIEAARRAAQTAVGVGGPISVVNTLTLEVRSA